MILTQHYLACLSHASYLIGDETTGLGVVVDPRRDVGVYLDEAAERGLRIERVIETHIHVDFLSGHLELATIPERSSPTALAPRWRSRSSPFGTTSGCPLAT